MRPIRGKRTPLPPNAKYLYEVYLPNGTQWRFRQVLGYVDSEDLAKELVSRTRDAQHTRVTGVLLGGQWYILGSVKPVHIEMPVTGIDAFDPCI